MSFARYPAYKDSGVKWFESLPSHWQVKRLGFSCDTLVPMRDKPDLLDGDIPWIRIEDFQGKYLDVSKSGQGVSQATVDAMRLKVLPAGTVLCSCSCSMGATAIVSAPLVTNQTFIGIVPGDGISSDYLYYFFQASSDYLNSIGAGAIQTYLSRDDFRQLRLPYPPVDEQLCITSFLDHETAKIDALVAEQERLIALLKEKRQAVISHAVTKGLDQSVPMKDSGLDWLGEVPAHWDFGPIKYFVAPKSDAIKTGPFGSHLTASDMQSGTIKVYNQRSVIDRDFDSGENYITQEKFEELRSFETYPGDLLITTRGTIGRAAIFPEGADRGILHPCLLRVQPDTSRMRTSFLMTLIQDSHLLRAQLNYLSNATTIDVIYSYTIASVVIPVPPVVEQDEIQHFLSHALHKFDELTAEAQHAVDALQERRTALISAAITGQIDLRGWVPTEAVA